MDYKKRKFGKNSSRLFKNKIFIIGISVVLVACVSTLIYFLVHNKNKETVKQSEPEQSVQSEQLEQSEQSEQSEQPQQSESAVSEEAGSSQESSADSYTSSETSDDSNDGGGIKLTRDYSDWNSRCSKELILVNANNRLPDTYEVDLMNYDGVRINSIIYQPLKKMIQDAREKEGLNLWLSSVYRSVDLQSELFQDEVNSKLSLGYSQKKAEELAAQEVARPRYSEHNTGLAVDFNGVRNDFKETAEYRWLCDNSYKYGFVLRYPEDKKNLTGIIFEPWHFRFLGVDVATKMKSSGMCFEEYVSNS